LVDGVVVVVDYGADHDAFAASLISAATAAGCDT
jgi:hypothetical protein